MTISDIISSIIKAEGSAYTDHPSDKGGPTKFGITQTTLANYRQKPVSANEVASLTEAEARKIYYARFILEPGFDRVLPLTERLAVELADAGVMSGPSRPILWLQKALNALNKQATLYPDIAEDGDLGDQTYAALSRYLKARGKAGETVLLKALNCLQGEFLIDISRTRQANEDFVFGWLANRVEV